MLKELLMKKILLLACLAVSYCGFGQEYFVAQFGKSFAGGTLLVKKKKNYLGFGASFFNNEIRKGRKFYQGSDFVIKKTELHESGTLFGVYGREISGFLVDVKLGVGVRNWYNLGTINGIEAYNSNMGGSYLVYGGNVRKELSPLVVGLGFDNFSGLSFSLGIRVSK